jgi:SAM-dependent methyltransferase
MARFDAGSHQGMSDSAMTDIRHVEHELLQVYDYCPPTRTTFASEEAWLAYREFWGRFFSSLSVPPERFAGARVLDAGCGSCEKAAFYHDWGGRVTGVDLSGEVLRHGRRSLGDRDVELLQRSLFDLDRPAEYDIAIVDGVSFVTADTERALKSVASQVKRGGVLLFSLTNVWGRFWWFGAARTATRALGGSDFHKRARWGRRLFHWTRGSQEGTAKNTPFYRSDESWAYDWFGPPAYHLHSPAEIRRWLEEQGHEHLASVPSLMRKDPPVTVAARILRRLSGEGPRAMGLYWLVNRAPNMVYVSAVRTR